MRYFIEVAYKGTNYAGFQVQDNANTVQAEVEKALGIVLRQPINLTGSSRTDAGVHALQNFFHFDIDSDIQGSVIYNINAILPVDIVVKSLIPVSPDAHCRFLALSRQYNYFISTSKDPFNTQTSWYYPYKVDLEILNKAATTLFHYNDFTSFSKKNTQVFTNNCTIIQSSWSMEGDRLLYNVEANRFLRGMVRALVGTMLLVGRQRISMEQFEQIIQAKDCTQANFATPAHGLFLCRVSYPPF